MCNLRGYKICKTFILNNKSYSIAFPGITWVSD